MKTQSQPSGTERIQTTTYLSAKMLAFQTAIELPHETTTQQFYKRGMLLGLGLELPHLASQIGESKLVDMSTKLIDGIKATFGQDATDWSKFSGQDTTLRMMCQGLRDKGGSEFVKKVPLLADIMPMRPALSSRPSQDQRRRSHTTIGAGIPTAHTSGLGATSAPGAD